MNLNVVLFYTLAALTAGSAVGVAVSQNIVRAATWLLFALAGTAGVFFQLGADFMGAAQLLIYVGGTLVLVVFGVMLTAAGPFITMKITAAEWVLNLSVGLLLYAVLAVVLWRVEPPRGARMTDPMPPSVVLGAALLGDEKVAGTSWITGASPPRPMERQKMAYLLPFEIVSVHLLVVLVGAAYLARARRRVSQAEGGGSA
jgi:NADH-quinone oxidoreductase subunit J